MPNDDRPGFYALNVADNLSRLSAIGAVSLIQENERFARENRLLEACIGFYREAVGELRALLDVFPDLDDRTVLSEAKIRITSDYATISNLKAEIKTLKDRIERDRFALDKYSNLLDQMGRPNEALRAEIATLKESIEANVTAVRPAGSRKRK